MESTSPDPGALRASDTDRNQVAELLGEAMADGRLTPEEYAERLDAVYAARTFADLEALVTDLPLAEGLRRSAAGADTRDDGVQDADRVTRVLLGKIRRCGQWVVPAEFAAVSRFGAIVLDMRDATFSRDEVVLDAVSFCGKIEIHVPDNARVYDTGGALLGKRTLPAGAASGPHGPVVHIRGRSVLGHIRVTRGTGRRHGQ